MTQISLATSAFNIRANDFDIFDAANNWIQYVDEICIATMESVDDTHEILEGLKEISDIPIQIIYNDEDTSIPGWDGRMKNSAHQAASHEVVAQIDLDERMGGKIEMWRDLAGQLLENDPQIKALLMPSIDLFGSVYTYSKIGAKWYLSVKNGTHRGIVNFAQRDNGKFCRESSDSCEILVEGDSLAPSIDFTQYSNIQDPLQYCRADLPFVWHLGFLDLERRANINKDFWQKTWNSYGVGEVNLETNSKQFEGREVFEHKIPIDFL
jgi:hypothetical protein